MLGTGPVVVLGPLGEDALEMAPVEDQHPVQALAPSRTDLPLHVGVALGAAIGVLSTSIPSALNTRSEPPPYLASWSWTRKRASTPTSLSSPADVPRLLAHPASVRPVGDGEPDHAPGRQLRI